MFGIYSAIISSKIICELKEKRTYSSILFKKIIIETIFETYKKYIIQIMIILGLVIIKAISQIDLN